MWYVIAIVSAISIVYLYACLVVASDADRRHDEEFEKWRNEDDTEGKGC